MPISYEKSDLFDYLIEAVKERQRKHRIPIELYDAFPLWFVDIYFPEPLQVVLSNGQKDAKVDVLFLTKNGNSLTDNCVNAKFTEDFNKKAPVTFYEEIAYFWRTFEDKKGRGKYLEQYIPKAFRQRYRDLYSNFDNGSAQLMFVTNYRRNDDHHDRIADLPIQTFYLDNIIQYLVDDIDVAMPRTPTMVLPAIHSPQTPETSDCEVPTSIVFARLIDFIKYMQKDPYDLLFARNIRLDLGNTQPNKEIKKTFKENPREFAYSNNGITMLCEDQTYKSGTKELILVNPRVVNGSQTLHSVRDVANPSPNARVLVRIIEIPPVTEPDLKSKIARKKAIITKIALRSNLQNPIEKWDLVANDDFQLELYRFFRRKGYFYERRTKEWKTRGRYLKSVDIEYGSSVRPMMQLMASYYWDNPKLGPGIAKQSVSGLFERRQEGQGLVDDKAYDLITKTSPELAYQIFLVGEMAAASQYYLKKRNSPKYMKNFSSYARLVIFSLIAKTFDAVDDLWGSAKFTKLLERQWHEQEVWDRCYPTWDKLIKGAMAYTYPFYRKAARLYRKNEGEDLSVANFFKTPGYVNKVVAKPIPKDLSKHARKILKVAQQSPS